MDVNRTNTISPLGSGSSKQEQPRESDEEKQDKDDESGESPWEGTEAFAFDGLLADGVSPEIQAAFHNLANQIEPLRAEVELAKAREAHFKELAEAHSFLPLPGRREFLRELAHLTRMDGGAAGSLIVLHLVNADDIRRRNGRSALDAVLTHVCTVIDSVLEPTDAAGSIGGNDFGIIHLVSDVSLARNKAENMVQAISANPLLWLGEKINLKAVAGVAAIGNTVKPEVALEAADKNLIAVSKSVPVSGEDAGETPPEG